MSGSDTSSSESKSPVLNEEDPYGSQYTGGFGGFGYGGKSGDTTSSRDRILEGLQSGDPGLQYTALVELNETLLMSSEESLKGFPSNPILEALSGIYQSGWSPEMVDLAGRVMFSMLDSIPNTADIFLQHNLVPAICNNLINIEFMDLAEVSLKTLLTISESHPGTVLSSGGCTCALAFFDWFALATQKNAIKLVQYLSGSVTVDNFHLISDQIERMTQLVQYYDVQIREDVLIAFSKLIENMLADENQLNNLVQFNLVSNVMNLLWDESVSKESYSASLKILTNLARGSTKLTQDMINEGIVINAQKLLLTLVKNNTTDGGSSQRAYDILCLINVLLPDLPKAVADYLVEEHNDYNGNFYYRFGLNTRSTYSPIRVHSVENKQNDAKIKLYDDQPYLIVQLGELLLGNLINLFSSNFNVQVQKMAVSAIAKIIKFSTAESLTSLLQDIAFSSFIARSLSNDDGVTAVMISLASDAMEKLPEIFAVHFVREGVIHEINLLIERLHKEIEEEKTKELTKPAPTYYSEYDEGYDQNYNRDYDTGDKSTLFVEKLKKLEELDQGLISLQQTISENLTNEDVITNTQLVENPETDLKIEGVEPIVTETVTSTDILLSDPTETAEPKIPDMGFDFFGSSSDENPVDTNINIEEKKEILKKKLEKVKRRRSKIKKPVPETVNKIPQAIILKEIIIQKVTEFKDKYFPAEEDTKSPGIVVLEEIVLSLNELFENDSVDTTSCDLLDHVLQRLIELFVDGLSDYELSQSSIVVTLIELFNYVENDYLARKEYLSVFSKNFLNGPNLSLLIDHLQSLMNTFHSFPLYLHNSHGAAGLRQFANPMKCNLIRDPASETTPKEVFSLSIEPLSTVRVIKDHILAESFEHKAADTYCEYDINLSMKGEVLDDESVNFFFLASKYYEFVKEKKTPANDGTMWAEEYDMVFTIFKKADIKEIKQAEAVVTDLFHMDQILRDMKRKPNFTKIIDSPILDLVYYLSIVVKYKDQLQGGIDFDSSTVCWENNQLCQKIIRQLQDLISLTGSAMPEWCFFLPSHAKNLIPLEIRKLLFNTANFDISRKLFALQKIISISIDNKKNLKDARMERYVVRIEREKCLEAAFLLLPTCAENRGILEVQYHQEAGTGLGPSIEFYTMTSNGFQRKDLEMWACDADILDESDGLKYVYSQGGLLPLPLSPEMTEEEISIVLNRFKMLGILVAKGIEDQRLLDIPFSEPFYKLMLEETLGFEDLGLIYPFLGNLKPIFKVARKKISILQSDISEEEKNEKISSLRIGDSTIEDLYLDFSLPRYNWELKEGGSQIMLNIDNVEEYVTLIFEQLIGSGIKRQMNAFKEGFNTIFPMENLKLFTVDELDMLICGTPENIAEWKPDIFLNNVEFTRGYTKNTPNITYLIETLCEFNITERRNFLRFLTGSPRLPIGGFKNLSPKFTVSKKAVPEYMNENHYLPSVNTCFLFLKLPEYSSKEILREKLLLAITEGQNNFALS